MSTVLQNGSVRNYWLYVVFNCVSSPEILAIQDPARLNWKPLSKIEQYQVGASELLKSSCDLASNCHQAATLPSRRASIRQCVYQQRNARVGIGKKDHSKAIRSSKLP